jgi:hypothetical protein
MPFLLAQSARRSLLRLSIVASLAAAPSSASAQQAGAPAAPATQPASATQPAPAAQPVAQLPPAPPPADTAATQPAAPSEMLVPLRAPIEPEEAPRHSTGMMIAGIVLTSTGSFEFLTGLATTLVFGSFGGNAGFGILLFGVPLMASGVIQAGIGIPLLAVGASRDEDKTGEFVVQPSTQVAQGLHLSIPF